MMLKLNGGRSVTGILRGFDPFMNVVIDETVEECRDGTKNTIGMVVCLLSALLNCHFHSKFIAHRIKINENQTLTQYFCS